MTHQASKRLEIIADVMGLQSRASLEFLDPKAAEENLKSLSLDPAIRMACLYDDQEQVFATYRFGSSSVAQRVKCPGPGDYGVHVGFDQLELKRVIFTEGSGRKLGALYLEYNLKEMHLQLLNIASVKFGVVFAMLILVWSLSRYFQRVILRPILNLADTARSFSKDLNQPVRAHKFNDDEIGGLVDAFNAMMQEIYENEQELGQVIEQLRSAKDSAEAANKTKSEFLANMSHEIRTPLNAVIGLAHVLSRTQPLTDRQKEFIETLRISGDNLLSLINDLLDFARLEDGAIRLEHVEFDLVQTIHNVTSLMNVRAQEKKLQLWVDTSRLSHRHYIGDPMRIQQIVTNLVSNAIKFTEKGYVRVAIWEEFSENWDGCEVIIEVNDSGIGIPAEKLSIIFDKFTQADASTSRKYGGTGLGLAISEALVKQMNGRIHVSSTVGEGATFTVMLPLEMAPSQNQADGVAESDSVQADSELVFMPQKAILLVEDYYPNVLVVTAMLEQFGYHCEVAHDSAEALKKLQNKRYALILMDIQLPGTDGMETSRRIRAVEKTLQHTPTPIIAVTAFAMAGDRERCLQAGIDDYLTKPFLPEALKEKMDALLGNEETT